MLLKSARLALALVLSLSLCPMAAYAVEGDEAGANGAYVATQADEIPVITRVEVNGSTITVLGSFFGSQQGSSTASVAVGGIAGGNAVASTVSSWSDVEIRLAVTAAMPEVVKVTVTTPSGSDSLDKLVVVGDDVYEESLVKPRDLFASDYRGPLPSSGILKGWGEYLYYLRETPVGTQFAYSDFERYGVETGEWETLTSLPEQLTYASGCVWEGNFLVMGAVYDATTGSATTEERIYMYNFELKDWVQLDSDGVPLGAGIVNLDGFLRVVGGAGSGWIFSDDVYEYDTGTGLGGRVASLVTPAFCPQLAVNQGQIFVYSYGDTLEQFNSTAGGASRHLQVVVGEDSVQLDSALPQFGTGEVPQGTPARSEEFGSIAAAIEGLMLVGPAGADGATDTFILDWDWEGSTLLPYYRTASDARLYGASACIHDNLLYAVAASVAEPGHAVFRATELMAPAVESGNYSTWSQGSDEPLTIVFTPDFSRFYDLVTVDGVELYGDSEYYVTSGSTVIDLVPSYLSTLATGEHEMTVYFDGYEDGPGAAVTAYFTVEGGDSPSPTPPSPDNPGKKDEPLVPGKANGYTRPAALAMTGDLLLIVPFVVLGAGAVALGIYLVRRKMRNNN